MNIGIWIERRPVVLERPWHKNLEPE